MLERIALNPWEAQERNRILAKKIAYLLMAHNDDIIQDVAMNDYQVFILYKSGQEHRITIETPLTLRHWAREDDTGELSR